MLISSDSIYRTRYAASIRQQTSLDRSGIWSLCPFVRQTDTGLKAMAFLSRYRAIRSQNRDYLSEVEFNFGRTFHQLGMSSLNIFSPTCLQLCLGLFTYAVKHYERVLEIESNLAETDTVSCLPE